MPTRRLPSQTFLLTMFRYDPDSGALTRGRKPVGRRSVSIGDVDYRTARVVWKMQTGHEPTLIDFVDGDETNLRFSNLVHRRSTTELRSSATSAQANSTTGVRGVHPDGRGGFRAEVVVDGRRVRLGRFKTVREAAAARRDARTQKRPGG